MASACRSVSWARKASLFLIFSGWVTGSPSFRALCLTGDSVNSIPRPRGRSGCVTTRRTWNPASTSFSRVGTAKRGVPAKMRLSGCIIERLRRCFHDLPLARLHEFADFSLHQVAFQGADVADVELAIQMISFVQEGSGQQFLASLFVEVPIHVLRANGDLTRTRDRFTKFRNTQAALILAVTPFRVNDLGVGKYQLSFGILLERHVNDREAFRDADLRSSQSHTVGGIHRLEHVLDEFLNLGIEDRHRLRMLFQNGVAKFYDGVDH